MTKRRTIFEPEHEAFRDVVRTFLARQVAPFHDDWEKTGIVPKDVWRKAGAQGLLGTDVPTEYGGGGVEDFRYNTIVMEEIVRGGFSGLGFGLHSDVVAPYLLRLATDEQKHRWLPGFCSGDLITAIAMTEPGAGSDLQGVRTTALDKGDHWILDGSKTFITNGMNADLVIVVARTDPDAGHKGISLLVVETGMEGFTRGRKLEKLGLRAQDTAELFFDGVVIPKENTLGEPGSGFVSLMQNLPAERLSIAIGAAAAVERAFELSLEHAKTREAFGKPIGTFQHNRFLLAEMATEADVLRTYVDDAITRFNAGDLDAVEAAKAKWFSTELEKKIVDQGVQIHGGYGFMWEYPITRLYADARVHTIYGGTTEIMKEIIGKSLGV